jgi:hypothetical protein
MNSYDDIVIKKLVYISPIFPILAIFETRKYENTASWTMLCDNSFICFPVEKNDI